MNILEPKLKNKPYEKSLRKFIQSPIGMGETPKEIENEAKKYKKAGKIEGARASYHMLVSAAIANEKVPAKDVKGYMNEYMKSLGKRKLPSSEYFPTKEDCSKVMKNIDEILNVVRDAHKKIVPEE
jgi:hypothetical protein